jgi:hypothetical protein
MSCTFLKLFSTKALFICTACIISTAAKGIDPKLPPDNVIIEVPGLKASAPQPLTWYVQRSKGIGVAGDWTEFNKIKWPTWDNRQSPPVLVSPSSALPYLIKVNKGKDQHELIELPKTWNIPSEYLKGKTTFSYSLIHRITPHLEIETPQIIQTLPKPLFRCQIGSPKTNAEEDTKLKSCLETIRGLAKETSKRWYISVDWPDSTEMSNDNQRFFARTDAQLRATLIKSGHDYKSNRITPRSNVSKTKSIKITAGLISDYIDIPALNASLDDDVLIFPASLISEKEKIVHRLMTNDGFEFRAKSFASDKIELGIHKGPTFLDRELILQFIPAKTSHQKDIDITHRSDKVLHHGLAGSVSQWMLSFGTNLTSLKSNRQHSDFYLGMPKIEAQFKPPNLKATFGSYLQSDLLHFGSSLAITEVNLWATYPINAIAPISIKSGWFGYGLSGKLQSENGNRLGSYSGAYAGPSFLINAEDYIWSGDLVGIVGLSGEKRNFGFSGRLGLQKRLPLVGSEFIYAGTEIEMAHYKSTLLNTNNTLADFSETRIQWQFKISWIGPGFLELN